MFAHLFSLRSKYPYSGGHSSPPPLLPHGKHLKALTSGQKFLCKSPKKECILTPRSDMSSYSLRQYIRSPEKPRMHLTRHTEDRDLNTDVCCFLSDSVFFFTLWWRGAVFLAVNLFSPTREVRLLHGDPRGSRAGTQ